MIEQNCHLMMSGFDAFVERIERQKSLFMRLSEMAKADPEGEPILRVRDDELFYRILSTFGPCADTYRAERDLKTLYEVGFHKPTSAVILANKGATLYCHSPRTQTPYISRHVGLSVYVPGLGIEVVNVAMAGDVYEGPVVIRSESACTPSFLFGSQRCNCAHQWETTRELAAFYNPAYPPPITIGKDFEIWVQGEFESKDGFHRPTTPGPGIIMMHVDTQNGMGSGYTRNEFAFDLFSRSSLRHRGEYTAEQVHRTTMAGGFRAVGIRPDPRGEDEQFGYMITPIVLDWLKVSKELIFLSNNTEKIDHLQRNNYRVHRIKSIGMVNPAGAQEAEERGTEFHHLDIDATSVTFESEMERLKYEISKVSSAHDYTINFSVIEETFAPRIAEPSGVGQNAG